MQSPKPGPHVKEITDSTQFWGDRVIKEFKEKCVILHFCGRPMLIPHRDPKHTQWVRGYIAILAALRTYVVATHTTGLTWNARVRFSAPVLDFAKMHFLGRRSQRLHPALLFGRWSPASASPAWPAAAAASASPGRVSSSACRWHRCGFRGLEPW